MDTKITLEYAPDLNNDAIELFLNTRYPEYTTSRIGKVLRMKKNLFVCVGVLIHQKEKKGITTVKVYGMMTRRGQILFGFLFHYLLRGSLIDDVALAIKEELGRKYKIIDEKKSVL